MKLCKCGGGEGGIEDVDPPSLLSYRPNPDMGIPTLYPHQRRGKGFQKTEFSKKNLKSDWKLFRSG